MILNNSIDTNSFFNVYGWMSETLRLGGTELLIFALIHSYTRSGEKGFYGNIEFIGNWFGISSPTVEAKLKSLVQKKYVIKIDNYYTNGYIKKPLYKSNISYLKTLGCKIKK